MGLAAALISLGTSVLVTSVVPVPDGRTVDVRLDHAYRLVTVEGDTEATD